MHGWENKWDITYFIVEETEKLSNRHNSNSLPSFFRAPVFFCLNQKKNVVPNKLINYILGVQLLVSHKMLPCVQCGIKGIVTHTA
jgi:hypothetical protein